MTRTLILLLALLPYSLASASVTTLIEGKLYRYANDSHVSVFYVWENGVVVTDPISSEDAERIKAEIADVTDKPVTHLIYSHSHGDHASGGEVFGPPAQVIAHRNAPSDIDSVQITQRFDSTLNLRLDENSSIELSYLGEGHGEDLIAMVFRPENVAFVVDAVSVKRLPYRDFGGANVDRILEQIRKVGSLDFDLLVGGHGAVGGKQDVSNLLQYFADLRAAVSAGLQQGKTVEQLKAELKLEYYGDWLNYDNWRELNIEGMANFLTSAATPDPVVQVSGGEMRGRLIAGGGATFKGVPFASPPVGELRWRDPQPVKPWAAVREANDFGPPCTQRIADWNRQEAQGNQEDCLYLNVWTNEWPAESPKAVMVWLHGGGNWGGAASVDYMDGTSLSRQDIVVVSINYRLGVFGCFAHPGLTAESLHHSSGNYGLLDQLAALQWVRENIGAFGGDPERVTLFGQSAGAIDTAYLAASPLAKGLIHRTIQQSGPPIRPKESLAQAEQQGVRFAESLNASADDTAAIKLLRSLSGPELQEAALTKLRDTGGPPNDPIIDGYLMPKDAAIIFQQGEELAIPMIVGSNAHEHARDYSREDILRVIDLNFGALAPKAIAYYGLDKSDLGDSDPLYGPTGDQASADTRHRCGAMAEAVWRSGNGRPTYQYQFDPPVAGEKLTRHQAEIGFIFGNLLTTGYLGGPYTDADRKISEDIQTYWANFAKTGDPNLPSLNGLPEWPRSNPTTRPYLQFTQGDGPTVAEGLRREICDLYIEALETTLPAGTAAARME